MWRPSIGHSLSCRTQSKSVPAGLGRTQRKCDAGSGLRAGGTLAANSCIASCSICVLPFAARLVPSRFSPRPPPFRSSAIRRLPLPANPLTTPSPQDIIAKMGTFVRVASSNSFARLSARPNRQRPTDRRSRHDQAVQFLEQRGLRAPERGKCKGLKCTERTSPRSAHEEVCSETARFRFRTNFAKTRT